MTEKPEIPSVLNDSLIAALNTISTATLTHQLQMRGVRSTFMSGLKPLHPEKRMVGRARTLRYVALREDLQAQYAGGVNAQKRVVESIEPGDVLVIEARGVPDAGTIGDIYATRLFGRGGSGVVTDGALRDTPAIADIGGPVYHQASHGSTYGRQHMPFSADEPVTCAGVFVAPGDVIDRAFAVADDHVAGRHEHAGAGRRGGCELAHSGRTRGVRPGDGRLRPADPRPLPPGQGAASRV